MSRSRKKRKQLLIPAGIVLAAAAAAGIFLFVSKPGENQAGEEASSESAEISRDTVIWQGKKYQYNSHLSNYLILGIDTREKVETSVGAADAGQADAIYLISRDRVTNEVTVISVPRDTMAEIEMYAPGGESLGNSVDHISLSFAYGDGGHESCRLTRQAVSDLFYGLPIQSYCALNMDGLPVLADTLGGVTVTVPNDSLEGAYPEYQEGSQVTLNAENTETFVRYRDTEESQSALARMERQQAFLSACGEAVKTKAAGDAGFAAKLYQALEPYMTTTMGADEFANIAEAMADGGTQKSWTVPGEGVEGESFDEYHVDDDALYEKIIETFYVEADNG